MKYTATAIDILRAVADQIDPTITIDNVVDNGNGTYDIITCDVKYAIVGFSVTIGSNQYKIIEVDDTTITVSGSVAITAETFDLYPVYFYHGTPIETNAQLEQVNNASDKTPMIWVLENINETIYRQEDTNLDRSINCRIFFLTQADNERWFNDDAYLYAIEPMRRLMQMFIDIIESNVGSFYTDDLTYNSTAYSKFVVYISNKGTLKNMFADKLAGVEANIGSLIVVKGYECCLDCV